MRIDKYLANMNVGSRKEVHKLIKDGLVMVNGAGHTGGEIRASEGA